MTLLIATPVRGGDPFSASVSVGYSEGVRLLSKGMPVETISAVVTFSCDVVRARNRLAAKVLREFPLVTHVLWWDDDQYFEDGHDGAKVIREMMDSGEPFIACPYTNKREPMRWVHLPLDPPQPPLREGLLEVRAVGFGMTMTSRACLVKMSQSATVYTDYPSKTRVWNLFGQLFDKVTDTDDPADETLLSEDYSFCKRWRDLGGHVMLKPHSGIVYHAGVRPWSARDMPGGVGRLALL